MSDTAAPDAEFAEPEPAEPAFPLSAEFPDFPEFVIVSDADEELLLFPLK